MSNGSTPDAKVFRYSTSSRSDSGLVTIGERRQVAIHLTSRPHPDSGPVTGFMIPALGICTLSTAPRELGTGMIEAADATSRGHARAVHARRREGTTHERNISLAV